MEKFAAGDTQAAWVEDLPRLVTDDIRLAMHRKYGSQYIFYRRRNKSNVECYCTYCMKYFTARADDTSLDPIIPKDRMYLDIARYIAHNETIQCPLCGERLTARAEGRGRKQLFEQFPVAVWFAADGGQTVYIVCGELYGGFGIKPIPVRDMEKIYGGMEWDTHWIVRLRPGEVKAVRRYGECAYSDNDIKEPYFCNGLYCSRHYHTHENMDVLDSSFLKYVCRELDSLYIDNVIKFMEYAAVYPSIEMLCKTGFGKAVTDIIDSGETYRQVIDLSGTKPSEIFRLDSNRAAALMRYARSSDWHGADILLMIKAWRLILRYEPKATINDTELFCINGRIRRDELAIYRHCARETKQSPRKILKYITDQVTTICNYEDYIDECVELGYDLTDSIINRPRDFAAAHERASSALRALIAERRAQEIKKADSEYREKIYPELCRKFRYSDDTYSIVVPTCADEIIEEGKQQRNCVAGYAERHISGKVIILFLRKNSGIGKSFGTLEIGQTGDKYHFRQAYAAKNKQLPGDAKKWLDKWLDRVNKKAANKAKTRIAVTA